MSDHRSEPPPDRAEDMPGDDFWADRDAAFATDDALAELGMDEMSDALHDMLGEETARRQWLKEATLTGELELPGLDDLAPLPEPDEGPDFG